MTVSPEDAARIAMVTKHHYYLIAKMTAVLITDTLCLLKDR
jgi:hypothetical protein